jgi:hypothetical protein
MDKLVNWYHTYYNEITWFIIGWLSLDLLHDFAYGNWIGMLIDAILIVINYAFYRNNRR